MKFAGPFQRSWIRERPQFDSTGCPIPVVKKSWCEWPSLLIIQPDAVHDLHMSFQMSVFWDDGFLRKTVFRQFQL